jgi:hypothetical protein
MVDARFTEGVCETDVVERGELVKWLVEKALND